jgi:dTDP-4-dehydrorhamnose reductase
VVSTTGEYGETLAHQEIDIIRWFIERGKLSMRLVMKKKLMIFGGSGFVGGNMTHIALKNGWQVVIADTRPGLQAEWVQVDITDQKSVDAAINKMQPSAVVNVAAIADIDMAEREQELAHKVNVDGARFVAESCAKRRIRSIYFSSDAVFDGEGSAYAENDIPRPVNYYGRTKLEAEQAVLKADLGAVVIRISLVLGFPLVSGNSFLAALEGKLKEGNEITAPTYEVRTPVDVLTLSECVLELCENDFSGVMHIGGTGSISRYELTKKLASRMGYAEALIKPQTMPDNKPGRAPRHKNGIILVDLAQMILKTRLLSTDEGILRAFNERPKTL